MVGDDAQAIYAFRAATVRNILDFPAGFVAAGAVVTLEQNYRSTQPILAAANAVIGLAREGFRKELFSTRRVAAPAQAGHGARRPRPGRARRGRRCSPTARPGLALRDQAVLFRTASHSAALELELARRNIPYVKFGGLRFFEAAHVKDLLAILRWAENPRDQVAAFRVLQLLPGVGPGTARRTLDALGGAGSRRLGGLGRTAGRRRALAEARDAADASSARHPLAGAARPGAPLLRPAAGGALRLRRQRAAPISTSSSASPATAPSRERFLTELTLDPPAATGGAAGPPLKDED